MQEHTRTPVFQEKNGTWRHLTKTVNSLICTIEYGSSAGFSSKEDALESYQQSMDAYQDQISRLKKSRKFRNTYATILSDYQVHIKTISQCLGHYSPDFTKKVYVFVKEPDVYDISHAIGEYVSTNRLLPVPRSWKETDVYLLPGDSVYREYFLNNFYSI